MSEIYAAANAVVAGVGVVLADDPHLMLDDPDLAAAHKDRGGSPHPARVVADSHVRIPTDARILDDAATTYPLVSEAAPGDRHEALEAAGVGPIVAGAKWVSLPDAFNTFEVCGVGRLMAEGGGELIFSLFEAGLADELALYVGSLVIDGRNAPVLTDDDGFVSNFPRLSLRDVERVDDRVSLTYDY